MIPAYELYGPMTVDDSRSHYLNLLQVGAQRWFFHEEGARLLENVLNTSQFNLQQ